MTYKKIFNLKYFLGILIVALFICLFFSQTIYLKNLPEVTAVLPVEKNLDMEKKVTLVPKQTIFDFGDGRFVFQIKKRKGILGDEYYVYKLNVQVGETVNEMTQIISGMEYLEPIVLSSDKELDDDSIVQLKNEKDFLVDY